MVVSVGIGFEDVVEDRVGVVVGVWFGRKVGLGL